jgi:hypothetical protein
MSPVKEPCYFASEIRAENFTEIYLRQIRWIAHDLLKRFNDGRARPSSWLIQKWEDYVRLFEEVRSEAAVGEASVAYLWSKTAARNIATRIPGARIVIILRDPAERAFSQYLHRLAMGLTRSTFRKHIEKCLTNRDRRMSAYYPFLEVGLYHDQVRRYLDCFPPHNIRIYWYEDAWQQPRTFLSDLFEFLGVDPAFRPDTSRKHLERRSPRFAAMNYAMKRFEVLIRLREGIPSLLLPVIRRLMFRRSDDLRMDTEDRRLLVDFYREDITKLASLLNRDLSAWLE